MFSTIAGVILRPRMIGLPPIFPGSVTMRANSWRSASVVMVRILRYAFAAG
jgi:hypothetical protein